MDSIFLWGLDFSLAVICAKWAMDLGYSQLIQLLLLITGLF